MKNLTYIRHAAIISNQIRITIGELIPSIGMLIDSEISVVIGVVRIYVDNSIDIVVDDDSIVVIFYLNIIVYEGILK